jgi:TetR/AcrR family transcriptional repressor of nem operon
VARKRAAAIQLLEQVVVKGGGVVEAAAEHASQDRSGFRAGDERSDAGPEDRSEQNVREAALECYADQIIATLLADLRQPDASLETVASFFARLAGMFRSAASISTRGCLLVNATAELAARDERARDAAANYRDRLRTTFVAALTLAAERGEIDAGVVHSRAYLLASALMGIWETVRIDPRDASRLCDTVAGEVTSWREGHGR